MRVSRLVAGAYQDIFPLSATELSLLHLFTASRLAQSALMSAYSYSKDPSNTYLLVTAQPGWAALQKLMDMPASDVAAFNLGNPPPSPA